MERRREGDAKGTGLIILQSKYMLLVLDIVKKSPVNQHLLKKKQEEKRMGGDPPRQGLDLCTKNEGQRSRIKKE